MSIHPINQAIIEGRVNDVLAILKADPDTLTARDIAGAYPIHYAAHIGSPGTLRMLLHKGADPNATNDLGCTPLFYAINGESHVPCKGRRKRYKVVANTLIGAGADIHHFDDFGFQPIHLAAYEDAYTIFEILHDAGGDIDTPTQELDPRSVQRLAEEHKCTSVMEYLSTNQ